MAIALGRKGVRHTAPGDLQRVQAGDELQGMISQLLQGLVHLLGTAGHGPGDHTQKIGLHPRPVQFL